MLRSRRPSFEEYPLNTDAVGSAPPDAFGPFRVLHQIGAGALGPVYRAYQPEQDRLVAVKLFRLDLPPERTHQFVAELEKLIAADLSHPAIAAPIATGISDVSAYLAQDFVAADSLDMVVRNNTTTDLADVTRVALQLGGALDLAAAIGITHGALHPRDVLLSPDDVRVTGMGVTRALDQVNVQAPIRRPYTAPERAAGHAWDRRADVFSLAALILELLSRRRMAGTGDQAVDALGEIEGANTRALKRALTRALAEEPRDRFATAGDFAKAIQAALEKKRPVATASTFPAATPESNEPATVVHPPIVVPDDVLPLLTDAMLSDEQDVALVRADEQLGDSDPLIGHSEPSPVESEVPVVDSEPAHREYLLGNDEAHESTLKKHEPEFDLSEIYEPKTEEPSVPPMFAAQADEDVSPRSNIWPLMLALVVGIAIGFGGAMLLLGRDRVPSQSEQAATTTGSRPAPLEVREEPIREFTERAVAEPPSKPAASAATPNPADSGSRDASRSPNPAEAGPQIAPRSPNLAEAGSRVAPVSPSPAKPGSRTDPAPSVAAKSSPSARPAAKTPGNPGPAKPPASRAQARSAGAPAASTRSTASRNAPRPAAPPAKAGPGSLAVDSRPAGASVFLNGKLIGVTPLVVAPMNAGEYAIHLDRAGYRRWATSVRIVAGERSRVAASLER